MPRLELDGRVAASCRGKGRVSAWDEQLVRDLTALWRDGHTTAEIGRRLGISKNAVVGKVRRLQLAPRQSPIWGRVDTSAEPQSPRYPAPAPELETPSVLQEQAFALAMSPSQALAPCDREPRSPSPALLEAATSEQTCRQCCWPMGEPGTSGFRFCEAPATPGKPYCGTHVGIAYVRRETQRHEGASDSGSRQTLAEPRSKTALGLR